MQCTSYYVYIHFTINIPSHFGKTKIYALEKATHVLVIKQMCDY